MKTSINLLCHTGFVERDHVPILELAKEVGFDGVEVPVLSGEPKHYQWLGKELDRIGLSRTSTSVVDSINANPVSSEPDSRARGVDHLNWALECAVALGAECVGGPFHAPLGHFTGSGPTEDELNWGADAHRLMAERAELNGIYLSLEPLNRFESYFLNTAQQARSYVQRIGHPSFRILYDTFHSHIEERDQLLAVRTLNGHIGVVHASENDRGIPGRGQINFPAIFRELRAAGFDDWVVVEAFGNSVPELAAATRIWRQLFPDLETLFRESCAYVRSAWQEARS
ncbi:MAG: sugar phosphate isomerase/epimerase family protein [Hyphomicrobiaceae bacterium]